MRATKINQQESDYLLDSNHVIQHFKLINNALHTLVEVLEKYGQNKIVKKNIINLAFERGYLSKLLIGTLREEMRNSFFARYVDK